MFWTMSLPRKPMEVGGNHQKGLHGTHKVKVPRIPECLTSSVHQVDNVPRHIDVPQSNCGGIICVSGSI